MLTENSLPWGHQLTVLRGTLSLLGMPFMAVVYE